MEIKMKDLIPNDVVELSKSEIKTAYSDNETSKAICSAVSDSVGKTNKLRTVVRDTLSKLSKDGTSQSNLYELELAMNNLKVQSKIDQMRVLKSTIEWCYNDLVKDELHPYFTKENRKSMKNVEVNTLQPCVMSDVIPPKGGNSNAKIVEGATDDIVVNLVGDDENKFQSKNRILFETFTELDEANELVITDKELEYTLNQFELFTKELIKARNDALALVEEVAETE